MFFMVFMNLIISVVIQSLSFLYLPKRYKKYCIMPCKKPLNKSNLYCNCPYLYTPFILLGAPPNMKMLKIVVVNERTY